METISPFSTGFSGDASEALYQVKIVIRLLPIVAQCIAISKVENIPVELAFQKLVTDKNSSEHLLQEFINIGLECPFRGLNIAELIPFPIIKYLIYSFNYRLPPLCQLNPLITQYTILVQEAKKIKQDRSQVALLIDHQV